jgi:hypothetical protein
MPSPFPGMDPYLERPAIWRDFHDSLITMIRGALQPLLRPRYVALTQDRLFVVQSDRPIYPDVAVVRTGSARPQAGAAVLEPDAPTVFAVPLEEIREPYVEILEPAAGNRLITAIEVLSPDNKDAGDGRRSYLRKCEEVWDHRANLVEIDLLREGEPTVGLSSAQLASLGVWHYLVAVSRREALRRQVYPIPLSRRLPRVAVPLSGDDPDVTLDLQAAFTRCYDEGPYPELLHYHEGPPGPLTPEEATWCAEVLRAAGLRPANGA